MTIERRTQLYGITLPGTRRIMGSGEAFRYTRSKPFYSNLEGLKVEAGTQQIETTITVQSSKTLGVQRFVTEQYDPSYMSAMDMSADAGLPRLVGGEGGEITEDHITGMKIPRGKHISYTLSYKKDR